MASIRIPKKYHGGLAKVLSLPEDQFQEIISNLRNAPFSIDFRPALRNAVTALEGLSADEARSITEALFSLYAAASDSDRSTEQFITGFLEALKEDRPEEFISISESPERVAARLKQLFEAGSVALAAKAVTVMFEHPHVFSKGRVLTDVRPVFGDSPEEARAVMIVHNLKIHYLDRNDHKDFFVALDGKDIQKLIDALERAKAKAETLKSILAAANVPYIESE